jgi:hypothetical protein
MHINTCTKQRDLDCGLIHTMPNQHGNRCTSPAKAIYTPVKSPREADRQQPWQYTGFADQHLGTAQHPPKPRLKKRHANTQPASKTAMQEIDMGKSGEWQSLHAVVEV